MTAALALLAVADSWGHMGREDLWMWTWAILMTLSWVVIVAGAVWLLLIHSATRGRRRNGHPGSSANDWQAGSSRRTGPRRGAA
jgi:heme/copper-type cytochrome/quinol oxidase subunit 2